jgi:tetratricopeptide (TPR) repeat protein
MVDDGDADPDTPGGPGLDRARTDLDLSIAAQAALDRARTDLDLSIAAQAALELAAVEQSQTVVVTGPRRKRPTTGSSAAFAATAFSERTDTGVVTGEPFEELPEGTLLADRYLVRELVGRGGMGTVYAAHDEDLDEEIALKVLRPDLARDGDFQKRLRAEVRLARRVSHPNVCRVHDIGVSGDLVFVTMELVRGRTLREELVEMRAGRHPPYELARIVDIVLQVGAALSVAHRAGVIHRDVKPDNVILTAERAVLTDFGVASTREHGATTLAGTPAYLAPEVLRHEPFDHRVDLYALAATAFELITSAPPYHARTVDAAMRLAHERPPYPGLPEAFAPASVRGALDRVLGRALASDPQMRTATVARFTDAFAHAARAAPLSQAVSGGAIGGSNEPVPSITPVAMRRSEVRIATALVWQTDEHELDMEAIERVVVDNGGTPLRASPGEIAALFGAARSTGAGGDESERAARAALALVDRFGGRAGIDTTRVVLRSGVNELAGPEAVTTAATLAAEAAPRSVLASPATARQLAAQFDVADAGAAGRRVVRARSQAEIAPVISFHAAEQHRICELVEAAFRERQPVFVEVSAPAGAGKTRLRDAVIAELSERRDVDWLIASLSPVGEPAPLAAVRMCSPEWYDAASRGDPVQRNIAARLWLEARATVRPQVVMIDNVQWLDPTTRALLDHLRAAATDVPLAVITFGRGAPASGGDAHVIQLGPLDRASAAAIVGAIAFLAPANLVEDVIARAGGNPFFLEELAHAIATGAGSGVPASIEAAVQSRLDVLPDAANQVALVAAIVGHVFERRAVAQLVPRFGDAALDAALGELERAGVITRTGDETYQFAQQIVHDVAYARSPARDRRQHHATLAGWLEEQTRGGDLAERERRTEDAQVLAALAHHLEHAGETGRAAAAYQRAGRRCLALYAYREATAALRKASALVAIPDPGLDEELADALIHTEGHAAAEPFYQRALDETDDEEAPARARLWYKLGLVASRSGVIASALVRYRAGMMLAAPGNQLAPWSLVDPRTIALLWGGLGWTLGYQLGRVGEGHAYCERAVALLETTPHKRDLAHALSRLGGTYMRACRFADQLRCNQRNLALAVELGDLQMQLTAHTNLGVVLGLLGQLAEAVAATEAARVLAARIGASTSDGIAASNLAGLYLEQGRVREAEQLLDEAIDLIERTGNQYILCETLIIRARTAAAHANLAEARRQAERALALARSIGTTVDAAVALRVLAQLDERTGDHALAEKRMDEALALARADAFELLRTRAAHARILAARDPAAAETAFAGVRSELERLGARRELAVFDHRDEIR